jgi:hypothetical protein
LIQKAKKSECPSFPWPGGKSALAPKILEYVPRKGRKFIDLCGGRGNITWRAIHTGLEYEEWIVNDILTAPFFRAIRDHGAKFKAAEKSQAEFDRCAELAKHGDPYALLMESHLCYNGGTYLANKMRGDGGGRRTAQSHTLNVRLAQEYLLDKKVGITQKDWRDCLEALKLGPHDIVVIDWPYLNCNVGAYSPETVCPTEGIEYFKKAPFPWVFCEYYQPFYVAGFGQPIFKKEVQLRSCDVQNTRETRTECIWIHGGKRASTVTVTLHEPVPEDRTQNYYTSLSVSELLEEIKEGIGSVDFSRNQMQRELRQRLLPALLELKKRTFRKHPNYYESLKTIGLNPDTVRQWFYRSNTADEVIGLLEEETRRPQGVGPDSIDTEALLLEHADRMATAVLDGKISNAKKLATEYVEARNESRI